MTDNIASLFAEHLRRNRPRSQRDCIVIAVRQSIAVLGPVAPDVVPDAVRGIVSGLFGDAYARADEQQRCEWQSVACDTYFGALLDAMSVKQLRGLWDTCDGISTPKGFCVEDIHAALNRKGDGDYCRV